MFFVMLLKEARDGFLFDCECRHLAKGSIRNDQAETKFLMEFLELKQITEVEEVKELIHYYSGCDYLEVRNKTIITLLFDTGMSCNEMVMMEPEDIKKDYIVVKHGKGNKERVVPKLPMLW